MNKNLIKKVFQLQPSNYVKYMMLSCNPQTRNTSTDSKNKDQEMRPVFLPNPFVSLKNYLWGLMVRGYFQQEFDLKEFIAACPHAMTHVNSLLVEEDFDSLNSVMLNQCKQSIIKEWSSLSSDQKESVENTRVKDITFLNPEIRMRMPEKEDGEAEIPAHLNIKMEAVVNLFSPAWKDYLPNNFDEMPLGFVTRSPMLAKINSERCFISFTVAFEREVTRGKDDDWKITELGTWPVPSLKLDQ